MSRWTESSSTSSGPKSSVYNKFSRNTIVCHQKARESFLTFKTDLGCSFRFRPSFSDDTTVIDDCVECRVFWLEYRVCDVMADNISVLLNQTGYYQRVEVSLVMRRSLNHRVAHKRRSYSPQRVQLKEMFVNRSKIRNSG